MKKILMFLLALPLALRSAPAPSARAILDKMVAVQEKQAVFSCEVRREEWAESTPEAVRKVRGTLKIKAVGKARFEITSPVRQLLVCDGKTLWMVMPEAKQVMRQNAESLKTSGQFFLDLASSIRYYSKNSQVRLVPDKEFDKRTTSALEITPKDAAAAGFDKVRVWVDRNRWQVLQALLTSSGSVVKARFLNIKTATKAQVRKHPALNLPNNLFSFKTPEGYEVFDSLFP